MTISSGKSFKSVPLHSGFHKHTTLAIMHILHPEETSNNSDNCDFPKVSDIGKALESMEN